MNYTLGNRNIEVSDIFRRIAFSQETRENPQNWKTFNAIQLKQLMALR